MKHCTQTRRKQLYKKMICLVCFHDVNFFPHICLVATCPTCYSPKEVYDKFCLDCQNSPLCDFCRSPAKYKINLFSVCITHLSNTCAIDTQIKLICRTHQNKQYEKAVKSQKIQKKLNPPRIINRLIAMNKGFGKWGAPD